MKNIKNFLLFVLGCAAAGCLLYFFIAINIFRIEGMAFAAMAALSVLMCALIVYLLSFLLIKEKKRDDAFDFGMFGSGGDKTAGLIEKTDGYIAQIKQQNDYIADAGISSELSQIEEIMRKMQPLLKEDTVSANRKGQLSEFFECYMPIIVKILNSYKRIENNRLKGSNADETKAQIAKIMPVIKKGFEKELDNMFTDEMVDITADVRVLESMLSKDGLAD